MGRGHTPSLSRERPGQRFRDSQLRAGRGQGGKDATGRSFRLRGVARLSDAAFAQRLGAGQTQKKWLLRAQCWARSQACVPPFCPCTHSARSVRPHFQKHGNGSRAATSCPSPRGQPTADGSYSQVHLPLRPRTILCPVTILQMRGPAGERVLSGNTPWARCGWGQWLSQAPGSPGSQGQTPQLWGGAEVSAQEPGSPTQVETAFKQ